MKTRLATALGLLAIAFLIVPSGTVLALAPTKPQPNALASKEFFKPELHISSSNIELEQAFAGLANKNAWIQFATKYGQPQVYLDPRSGVATSVVTSIPMIPGRGDNNALDLKAVGLALGRKVDTIDSKVVADLTRKFVVDSSEAFGIDSKQLGAVRAVQVADQLWNVSIPQFVNGVPVRFGQIVAVINGGNLVLTGAATWGNATVDTKPTILEADAMSIGSSFVGGIVTTDELWKKPSLEIVPIAPAEFQSDRKSVV